MMRGQTSRHKTLSGCGDVLMSSLRSERDLEKPLPDRPTPAAVAVDLEPIRTAIRGIRFGEVRIIIQDGVVVQIDRMEKQRVR
jgi:hypothetical protein